MSETVSHRRGLQDLTLKELWQLFPIILRDYDPQWPGWYGDAAQELRRAFGPHIVRISHIGSTSVAGLIAKPTVDILLELDRSLGARDIREKMAESGWLHMGGDGAEPLRMSFNKGYTPRGFAERVFHAHVRRPGDPDELYFRDYLREHPETCRDYVALKRHLASVYQHDRDAYTDAKGKFIAETTARAPELYGARYLLEGERSS
jgi:GrpB-like predicted nucleotidyltransferase (UPF0157 family)